MKAALTNLVISEEALAGIEGCLNRLVIDANANSALLLDQSGQIVSAAGDFDRHKLIMLGALLAGHFASAREIARLVGERTFRVCYQQGIFKHTLTSLVGETCLLSVIFDKRTPLGLVKVLSANIATELGLILQAANRQVEAGGTDMGRLHRLIDQQLEDRLRES